jgi:hypothetical protein
MHNLDHALIWNILFSFFLKAFFLNGDMDKQALKHICLQFFQFWTNFNETFSKRFFWAGSLNGTVKSDLTLMHSSHFALFFQLFFFQGREVIFYIAKCVLCSAKCALCSGVRSDLTMPFKPPAQKNICWKFHWNRSKIEKTAGKCALEPVCPYPLSKISCIFLKIIYS